MGGWNGGNDWKNISVDTVLTHYWSPEQGALQGVWRQRCWGKPQSGGGRDDGKERGASERQGQGVEGGNQRSEWRPRPKRLSPDEGTGLRRKEEIHISCQINPNLSGLNNNIYFHTVSVCQESVGGLVGSSGSGCLTAVIPRFHGERSVSKLTHMVADWIQFLTCCWSEGFNSMLAVG